MGFKRTILFAAGLLSLFTADVQAQCQRGGAGTQGTIRQPTFAARPSIRQQVQLAALARQVQLGRYQLGQLQQGQLQQGLLRQQAALQRTRMQQQLAQARRYQADLARRRAGAAARRQETVTKRERTRQANLARRAKQREGTDPGRSQVERLASLIRE